MQVPRTVSGVLQRLAQLDRNARIAAHLRFEREWRAEAAKVAQTRIGRNELTRLYDEECRKRAGLVDGLNAALRELTPAQSANSEEPAASPEEPEARHQERQAA